MCTHTYTYTHARTHAHAHAHTHTHTHIAMLCYFMSILKNLVYETLYVSHIQLPHYDNQHCNPAVALLVTTKTPSPQHHHYNIVTVSNSDQEHWLLLSSMILPEMDYMFSLIVQSTVLTVCWM